MFSLYLADSDSEGSKLVFGGVDTSYLKDPKSTVQHIFYISSFMHRS